MRIWLTRAARAELSEAHQFYDKRRLGLGDEFLDEVGRVLRLIKERPDAVPLYHHTARRRLTRRFPYGLVYVAREGDIVVIAVAHQKRRPMYWQRRLPAAPFTT